MLLSALKTKAVQFYLHRVITSGGKVSLYVQQFLKSKKKKTETLTISVIDEATGKEDKFPIRFIRGPKDSEGKPIVFTTKLIGERYTRRSLLKLYLERWTVETLYGWVKTRLNVEHFHARSYNGVMQEIFANLLVISMTALVWATTICFFGRKPSKIVPGFKNTVEVVRRHFFDAIDTKITGRC